ncbi:MAG: internal scaffolding protein [Microvirus sp.]|nr:MAG: internal scaffolding protein [Microvirus sp.]
MSKKLDEQLKKGRLRPPVQPVIGTDDEVQHQHAAACDINQIIAAADRGVIPPTNRKQARYEDNSSTPTDFATRHQMATQMQEAFQALSPEEQFKYGSPFDYALTMAQNPETLEPQASPEGTSGVNEGQSPAASSDKKPPEAAPQT